MKNNIIANFVGRFWSILSNFLFIPLYIDYLGFDSYSVISFTLMIAGIMAVLDGGLTATLSREFARKDNTELQKQKIFKNVESLYFIVTGFCIALIFLFSNFIAEKWILVEKFSPSQISFFLKIISFEIGFQLLFRFYVGGLLGLEKQVQANAFQVLLGIVRNGLIVFALILMPYLKLFFLWQAFSTVIFTILIKVYLEKVVYGKFSFTVNLKLEKSILTTIWKFAGGMLLIALVSALNTQLDKVTISKLLSLENLGYYTLAVSLSQGLIILVNPVAAALLPRFTAHFSNSEYSEARSLFLKSSLIVSIIIFSVLMTLSFFAKEIIWVWTGKLDLAEKSFQLIPIVALAYTMFALQVLPYNIAIANGYTKLNNILGIMSLIVTIPGYYFATKEYGAMGAATVFCFVQIITTFIFIFFINKKFIKSNILKDIYWEQYILPFLVIGVLAYLFSLIPISLFENRIMTLVWIVFITFATLIFSLGVFIPKKEILSMIRLKIKFKTQ